MQNMSINEENDRLLEQTNTELKDYNTLNTSPSSQWLKYKIGWLEVSLLTFAQSINQLIFKYWFVFAVWVDKAYNIGYQELSWSLAISLLVTIPTLLMTPFMNNSNTKFIVFVFQLFVGIFCLLNGFLGSNIFNIFIIRFLCLVSTQNIWTIGNSIIVHFMPHKQQTNATTIFMGSWNYATILFIITGVIIQNYGVFDFEYMAGSMAIFCAIILFFFMPSISLSRYDHIVNNQNGINDVDDNQN
eukprot:75183_1